MSRKCPICGCAASARESLCYQCTLRGERAPSAPPAPPRDATGMEALRKMSEAAGLNGQETQELLWAHSSQRYMLDSTASMIRKIAARIAADARRMETLKAESDELRTAARMAIPELRCMYSQLMGESIDHRKGGGVKRAVDALSAALSAAPRPTAADGQADK